MKKFRILMIFLLLIQSILLAQQEKMRVAIMDLKPMGVPDALAGTVSDLLRTELFNTGLFEVIERAEMDKILKEQGFQQSGCTENECAVQFGKLLSAQKVLVGTLNKLGDLFIINARIVDVEKGVMEFADNTRVQSESDLAIGCKDFARKIAAKIRNASPQINEQPIQTNIQPQQQNQVPPQKTGNKYYYPLRIIGLISIGAGILAAGLGIYFDGQAFNNNNASRDLYTTYLNAISGYDTAWNAYQDKHNLSLNQAYARDAFFISGGVLAAFGVVSVFIIKKPVMERISMRISPSSAELTCRF